MKKSLLFYLVSAWLIVLPWHAFLKTWLSHIFLDSNADYLPMLSNVLSTWKEIALIIILSWGIWKTWQYNWGKWWRQPSSIILILYIASILIFGTWHTPDWKTWLLALRTDLLFLPTLLAGIVVQRLFSETEKWQILKWTCYSLLIATGIGLLTWFIAPNIGLYFGYSPYESSYVEAKPLPMYHCLFIQDHCIPRLQASFAGPNQAGALMALLLGLMSIVFSLKGWLLIPFLALILTFSRSALVGVLMAGIYWIPRKWLTKICITTIVLVAGILLWKPDLITHGLSSVEHWDKTTTGIEHIIQSPLGSGLGTAGPVSRRIFGEEQALISENWYLQIAEEAGIPSLILLLLLTVWIIRSLFQQNERNAAIIASVLLATSIQALFLHLWEDSVVTMLVWFFVGIVMSIPRTTDKEMLGKRANKKDTD